MKPTKVWQSRPEILLMVMAAAMPIAFWAWVVLLNNFTVEVAAFTGKEIGVLQSLQRSAWISIFFGCLSAAHYC